MNESGLVTGRHRRHVLAETADGEKIQCIVRGRQLRPLVGDIVTIERLDDGTAAVTGVNKRQSILNRIDSRGHPEGVAANVTQLIIVAAPRPAPDWSLVDRYLAAAELEELDAALVWNKADMSPADQCHRALYYQAIGYALVETSVPNGIGIDALRKVLGGHRSVLVGQSGVGKSSLINCLLGENAQAVGHLSDKRALGRHTTTAAEMYRLADGGELIDSPGVRQYAPHLITTEGLDWAFREFRPCLGQCRFDNCRHEAEPGCAIKGAVEQGTISTERLESYLTLRRVLSELNS